MSTPPKWEAVATGVRNDDLPNMKPGEPLNAAEIANKYGVSSSTVRNEVFPYLEGRGLIRRENVRYVKKWPPVARACGVDYVNKRLSMNNSVGLFQGNIRFILARQTCRQRAGGAMSTDAVPFGHTPAREGHSNPGVPATDERAGGESSAEARRLIDQVCPIL
jgi:hypothetical protein